MEGDFIVKKAIVVGVIILVLIGGVVYFNSQQTTEPAISHGLNEQVDLTPITARGIHPKIRDVEQSLTVHGRFMAESQVHIIPKSAGRIEEVFVEIGDYVTAGDPLIQVEAREVKLQLEQAEASLKAAEATLAKVKSGARPEEIEQVMANLEQAQAHYNSVNANYQRAQYLFDEGVISATDWEGIQTQYEVTKAQQLAAQKTLDLVVEGATLEDVQATEATVAQARVGVELAKLMVENTTITTPITGRVSRLNTQIGDMIGSGMSVGTVVDLDAVKLMLQVSSRDAVRLQKEQRAVATVDALPGQQFDGTVANVSLAADEMSGMFTAEIIFDNPEHLLRPGMYGNTEIIITEVSDALTLPRDAIYSVEGSDYIFLVENDIARSTPVETGLVSDDWVEIRSGVTENDVVAISDFLQDGIVVHLEEWGESR